MISLEAIKIILRKTFSNRRKFFTYLTGLIISTSLLSGISIFSDVTSRSVIDSYYDDDVRTVDIMQSWGNDPVVQAQNIRYLAENNGDFDWIGNVSAGYRWQSSLFTPLEVIVPNDVYAGSISLIFSVEADFYSKFHEIITIINGTFDTGPGKGVISEIIAKRQNIQVGDNMSIFSWLQATYIRNNFTARNINRTSRITITGIVAGDSKIFSSEFEDLSSGFYYITRLGCIFTGFSEMPDSDYYNTLRFQPTFGGIQNVFDDIVFIQAKRQIVNFVNPDESLFKLNELEEEIGAFTLSPLRVTLNDYKFWLTTARVYLSILSLPIILIGWYMLNFSFSHTFDERKREIANLKSRGANNKQIWFMILFESVIIGIIGAAIGVIAGVFLNVVLETSTGFFVFDFSLLNFNSVSVITPYTFIITILTTITAMLFVSIYPVTTIINKPIDEITSQEEGDNQQEIFELRNVRTPIVLTFTGLFTCVGLITGNQNVTSDWFLMVLSLVSLLIYVSGSMLLVTSVARFLPLALEKVRIGTNSAYYFLVARDLSRRSIRTTAMLTVLTVTLAFGIFSSLTIHCSTYYLEQEALYEIGSDIKLSFTSTSGFTSCPETDYWRLKDSSVYPEIKEVTRYLQYPGLFIEEEESYPTTAFILTNRIYNTLSDLNVIFINSTEYSDTVFYRDYFIESLVDDPLKEINSDPFGKILIDKQTASMRSLAIGDYVKFSSGRQYPYNCQAEIVGLVDYFSPGLTAGKDSFIIVDRSCLTNEFHSAEYSSTQLIIKTEEGSDIKDITRRIETDSQIFGIDDVLSVYQATSELSKDIDTLMSTLNLDFYFSLIVSAVGFFIVLEIRVQEKKEEIGIIKALGMSNRQTVGMIFLEGSFSIVVASAAGLITGVVSGSLLVQILFAGTLPMNIVLPLDIFALQLSFAVIFAFIGIIFPARLTNRWVPADLIQKKG